MNNEFGEHKQKPTFPLYWVYENFKYLYNCIYYLLYTCQNHREKEKKMNEVAKMRFEIIHQFYLHVVTDKLYCLLKLPGLISA